MTDPLTVLYESVDNDLIENPILTREEKSLIGWTEHVPLALPTANIEFYCRFYSLKSFGKKTLLISRELHPLPNAKKLAWLENKEFGRHEIDPKTGLSLPTFIKHDGTQEWWEDSKLHREDGPAVIYPDGDEAYYIGDMSLKKVEWEKHPSVLKFRAKKKLEDPKIKDDDFLRTFGEIL